MNLIIGLGNPEPRYDRTRHNLGFMTLDAYVNRRGVSFDSKPKFFAELAELTVSGEKLLLAKPTTYYNETGRAVQALQDFYKLSSTDILVIHDDLALPFGTIRTRRRGSDAGNNGIKSITSHIGQDYARVRVGIYNDLRERMPDADFVLSKFSRDEQEALQTLYEKIAHIIDEFANNNFTVTSHSSKNQPKSASE